MPILLSASMASFASGRTVSATAITPRIWPFRATKTSDAASLSWLRDDGTGTPRPASTPVADENGCAVHKSRNAPTRRVVKTLGLSDRTAQPPYIGNDGLAERMLGAQLGRSCRVQYFPALALPEETMR